VLAPEGLKPLPNFEFVVEVEVEVEAVRALVTVQSISMALVRGPE
jgi:hypothetical protein